MPIIWNGNCKLCNDKNNRAIQGIGGGALVPITFTIIFDIFPPEKRGKMTGLFGAVFGLSSIFGPLLGAYITDYINWNWIFYTNLPLGITSLVLISLYYKESHEHQKQKTDWLGAFTLVGAVVCLMFALELGGNKYAWDSTNILSLFTGFAVLFIVFLFARAIMSEQARANIPKPVLEKIIDSLADSIGYTYSHGLLSL